MLAPLVWFKKLKPFIHGTRVVDTCGFLIGMDGSQWFIDQEFGLAIHVYEDSLEDLIIACEDYQIEYGNPLVGPLNGYASLKRLAMSATLSDLGANFMGLLSVLPQKLEVLKLQFYFDIYQEEEDHETRKAGLLSLAHNKTVFLP